MFCIPIAAHVIFICKICYCGFCWLFCQNSAHFFLLLVRMPFGSNARRIVWFQHLIVFGNCFAFKVQRTFHVRILIRISVCASYMHMHIVVVSVAAVAVFSGFLVFLLLLVSKTRMFIKQNIHRMWKRESCSKTLRPFGNLPTTAAATRAVTMQIIRIYICHINFAHKFAESNKTLISAW